MKHLRRLLVLLLSLTLVLPMLTGVALAEVYNSEDVYVLNFKGDYDNGTQWQYFSPYYPAYIFNGKSDYARGCLAFSLYNTKNNSAVIPTYCTDLATGLDNNSYFRRINLEDSTYAASSAGVLRSIMRNGFPAKSISELGAAAGVEGLTVGEAVAATQTAIWKVTHGTTLEFTDFCYIFDTNWSPDDTAHYNECNKEITDGYAVKENKSTIESHINAVYAYLINLAPTSPSGKAVSTASFTDWSDTPTLSKNEDGTYNVTVSASTSIGGTADVTLSAYMADNKAYVASTGILAGSDSATLTIQNVPAELAHGEVILAIDGYQTVSDVFLFDAVGDRGSSQSLIGIDDSRLPVHAEITVQPERVIHFEKHEYVGENNLSGKKLEGIHFDIYYKASLEKYLNGEFVLSKNPATPSNTADYTVVTDSEGRASFSLTKNNLPDGVYLIVERPHPAISKPVAPFYVILPATNEAGTGYDYEITIYPKNVIAGDIDIDKDVTSITNDSSNVDAANPHTWIISATIPADIAQGEHYIITDTLDSRLNYVGNVKAQVEAAADPYTVVDTLIPNLDYTAGTSTNENGATVFTFSLTNAGMTKVYTNTATNVNGYRIRVYFDTILNASAEINTEIPNQASISYKNSLDITFTETSDTPVVYTGGIQLEKVDGATKARLANAEFEIYRVATEEEIKAGVVTTKMLINNVETDMVKVNFRNAEINGALVDTAVSDENGMVYLYGLKNGTYYVVETKAPAGYNLLKDPIELVVGPAASTADTEAEGETSTEEKVEMPALEKHQVENRAGAVLPETGGMGTTVLYVGGSLLVLLAFVCLTAKRKAC